MNAEYTENLGENLKEITKAGDHVTPLTTEDFDCYAYLRQIEALAKTRPQTALAFGMHLYTLWAMSLRQPDLVDAHRKSFMNNGALMCSLNDSGTYFKAPDKLDYEKFPVKARRQENGYVLWGKKPFSSMSKFVNYIPVTALEKTDTGNVLVTLFSTKDDDTVEVQDDWSSVAMPDTETNSIIFRDTFVPNTDIIFDPRSGGAIKDALDLDLFLYRFHICVTYYAMATATRDHILGEFSGNGRAVGSFQGFPYQQYKLAEIVIEEKVLHASITYLCDCLNGYMQGTTTYEDADINTLIFKEKITASSVAIVEKAMEISGIRSLTKKNQLSSMFNNVKAGRFHPPQPASALELIAKKKLSIDPRNEPRWG